MSNFKKGDRVRRASKALQNNELNGDTGTVMEDNNSCPLVMWDRDGANRTSYGACEITTNLELIEPEQSLDFLLGKIAALEAIIDKLTTK